MEERVKKNFISQHRVGNLFNRDKITEALKFDGEVYYPASIEDIDPRFKLSKRTLYSPTSNEEITFYR